MEALHEPLKLRHLSWNSDNGWKTCLHSHSTETLPFMPVEGKTERKKNMHYFVRVVKWTRELTPKCKIIIFYYSSNSRKLSEGLKKFHRKFHKSMAFEMPFDSRKILISWFPNPLVVSPLGIPLLTHIYFPFRFFFPLEKCTYSSNVYGHEH